LIRIFNTDAWGKYMKRLKKVQSRKESKRIGHDNPQNVAEEMMMEINEGHEKVKKKV